MKQFALLNKFGELAKAYLLNHPILDIQFSGYTYQMEMFDEESGNLVFPFLQFDQLNNLKDCFCSCRSAEESNSCVHLAVALIQIYRGHSEPLHFRFQNSIWNQLGLIAVDQIGYELHLIKKISPGEYEALNQEAEQVFWVRATERLAIEKLNRLIENRPKETEETSLKFSNLSQEDILHWREGRPSHQLKYELSFWSDFAKWQMLLQEDGIPYTVHYDYGEDELPKAITIQWQLFSVKYHFSSSQLLLLIPKIDTFQSPLKVYKSDDDQIEYIEYDNALKIFQIHKKIQSQFNFQPQLSEEKIAIGHWYFIPHQGFYSKQSTNFTRNTIPADEIESFLDEHHREIKPLLRNTKLNEGHYPINYQLYFDSQWNLHIKTYLFEEDDLKKKEIDFFGKWLYIPQKGFFAIHGNVFNEVEMIIAKEDVSQFINHHRILLNNQIGFQTHISVLESQLVYSVTRDGNLKFINRGNLVEESETSKDFGEWIYFKGEGFYSKLAYRAGFAIRPGLEIPSHEVAAFIRNNREELDGFPNFFLPHCPVAEVGLKLELKFQSKIIINPIFKFLAPYTAQQALFFGDFVYIQGRGFYELPFALRLPDRYRQKVVIGPDLINFFVRYDLESLKKWIISLDVRLQSPEQYSLEVSELDKNPEGGIITSLYYKTELGKVYVTQIQSALRKGKRFLFSDAGLLDLQDERWHWAKRLPQSELSKDKKLVLSVLDFLRIETTQDVKFSPELLEASQEPSHFLHQLREFQSSEEPQLMGLKSDLRPYQKTGIRWLWFLYSNDLSGLLCDDMGLGKTHQAMALIAAIKNNKSHSHFLVTCPTSVIYHWEDKLNRFFPHLKILVFHGVKRSLDDFQSEYDLLLTSYGILRSEQENLKKIHFDLAVFDEIQVAKNAQSRIHNALLAVNAKMKLGLTGTPIENNLRELKALFDIVLKGYMPSEVQFKKMFINPIEKEANSERKQMLAHMVRPFILRRKKIEVLQELPEKTEESAFCELTPQQIDLYKQVLERQRTELISNLSNQQNPIPYVHIFALLSTLKQICNHPALYYKKPGEYKNYHSGKWDLFVELLNETIASNQKVVVFSQYLQMLDIIELHVKEQGWQYAQIRGETLQRSVELKRFQEDDECKVFIGSLQAAGLGIDLTAASVVIHYDRWWNAARENQATDRVHRIGQKRGVQVFKLMTKDTLEEKIDVMIEKKGRLMEEIILSDDEQQIKKFTRDELIDLLSFTNSPYAEK